jgi:hypothetical protein
MAKGFAISSQEAVFIQRDSSKLQGNINKKAGLHPLM